MRFGSRRRTRIPRAAFAAAWAGNCNGPGNLAAACRLAAIPLVHISTDYVFDGSKKAPYVESDPVNPLGVYGQSKEAGERAVRDALPEHVILRSAWLYSAHGHNFVKTMLRLADTHPLLRVVADQVGSPTYAGHLAEAVRDVVELPRGVWHVAAEGECTWFELAAYALAAAGVKVPLEPTDTAAYGRPAPRPAYSVLSNQLYEHATGHRMAHWQEAVERYLLAEGRSASAEAAGRR